VVVLGSVRILQFPSDGPLGGGDHSGVLVSCVVVCIVVVNRAVCTQYRYSNSRTAKIGASGGKRSYTSRNEHLFCCVDFGPHPLGIVRSDMGVVLTRGQHRTTWHGAQGAQLSPIFASHALGRSGCLRF